MCVCARVRVSLLVQHATLRHIATCGCLSSVEVILCIETVLLWVKRDKVIAIVLTKIILNQNEYLYDIIVSYVTMFLF